MAAEVFKTGYISIAPGSHFNLTIPTGREATIHNIIVAGGPVTLSYYDSLIEASLPIDVLNEAGYWMGMFLHCTENYYLRLTNNSGGYIAATANGRYSK